MTEFEKISVRQSTLQTAISCVHTALTADRVLGSRISSTPPNHWETALAELAAIERQLANFMSQHSK